MKRRIIFQVLAFIIIYSFLTFYIGWNSWIWLHSTMNFQSKWIFGIIIFLLSYSYVIGHFYKRWSLFKILGSYWFAILQYSLLLLPIADLVVLLGNGSPLFIKWAGVFVLAIFTILFWLGTYNAYSPVIRPYSIVIPKQVKKVSKLRIAMASDMHFGLLSGITHVKRLVKLVNQQKPDLILLPGDIIDDDPHAFIRKNFGDIMQKLSAPLGIYGVLGNHEYYGKGIPEFTKEMERIGITILQDGIIEVEDTFFIVGRKDKTDSNRKSINELLSDLNSSKPIIMMDHQPTDLEEAEKNHVDLLLSGHTHRGQMAPNHLFTRKLFELDWGYLQKNQLHTFVSSGFGFWGPPLRIGSRSEIIVIDITFSIL